MFALSTRVTRFEASPENIHEEKAQALVKFFVVEAGTELCVSFSIAITKKIVPNDPNRDEYRFTDL